LKLRIEDEPRQQATADAESLNHSTGP
jgi:hypothetical protein